jgi:membrane protein DedA with SNARE-associated domain
MKAIKFLFLLALSLAFWSATFAMIGYAFLSVAPCHWFGSSFEGTCGYRGALFTVVVCAFLSIGMAVFTVARYYNKSSDSTD